MRRALIAATACALAVGLPSRAEAAQSCAIVGTVGVRFGAYDTRAAAPLDSAGRVLFVCHGVTPADVVRIQLSRGMGAPGTAERAMVSGRFQLGYGLYLDAARTLPWGDGSGSSGVFTAVPPEGATMSVEIYGRVPPRQNVGAGVYSDVIVVTVVY